MNAITFPGSDNLPKSENKNFYGMREQWQKNPNVRTFNDDIVRTLATIQTSGNKCSFFDEDGNSISAETFTTRYDRNSARMQFIVLMDKERGVFLIKPLSSGLRERARQIRWSLKNLLWKKDAA
jgi:hypothetical protein